MALDKQRILNELGSVMNQLQSADCGCMGRLFGNSRQAIATPKANHDCEGRKRNCCYGHANRWNSNGSCGEPHHINAPTTCSPCMGHCNPPKLYADTYNYLTDNLIQPTIKEVYNDLKSLTPGNTIANNPMANQIGLSSNSLAAQDNMGNLTHNLNAFKLNGNTNDGVYNNFTKSAVASSMPMNEANQMGGMGPQIVNMIGSNMQNKHKTFNPVNSLQEPLLIDAPQSPHGQIGVTPLSAPMKTQNINNVNAEGFSRNYTTNHSLMQSNMQLGGNVQNTENIDSSGQRKAASQAYGHHSQGVTKFNEMFPGVMQNIGGDLGFDPMSIAIQMNPANQQQSAMNSMNKLMRNNDINKVFDQSGNSTSLAVKGAQQNQTQNNLHQSIPVEQTGFEIQSNANPTNGITYQNAGNFNKAINNHNNIYERSNAQQNNQQAVYTASSRTPMLIEQTSNPDEQYYMSDPKTCSVLETPTLSPNYGVNPSQQVNPESFNAQRMIKEPILPVDTSRHFAPKHTKYFEFNTLGQPVEKFAAEIYHTPEPHLPQTLSPQSDSKSKHDTAKYSKVKSTVSKTSIMGGKIGRTPSQLQQIYNQYKGSQSYTQQNITAPSVNAVSHSEGKLNASQASHQQQEISIEKVGGDTIANNEINNERSLKIEQVMGRIGDVAPVGDGKLNVSVPIVNHNTRNGLQDIVYTSYPTSAAWSFHGPRTCPYSPGRSRYR